MYLFQNIPIHLTKSIIIPFVWADPLLPLRHIYKNIQLREALASRTSAIITRPVTPEHGFSGVTLQLQPFQLSQLASNTCAASLLTDTSLAAILFSELNLPLKCLILFCIPHLRSGVS